MYKTSVYPGFVPILAAMLNA